MCLVARSSHVFGPISVDGVQRRALSVVEAGYGGHWPKHWISSSLLLL